MIIGAAPTPRTMPAPAISMRAAWVTSIRSPYPSSALGGRSGGSFIACIGARSSFSAYVFLLKHRWPAGMMKQGWRPWLSPMGTNLAIAAAAFAMSWLVGFQVFLLVHVPMVLVAATLGVWLFYVQHQFEETVWDTGDDWSFHTAAVHGSSYYELPTVLRWVTANIGIHHVHHLASRIPFYRLNDALRDFQDLATINRIGIVDSLRLVRLALWDEKNRRMVSFREAKALAA
jgi:omega-6 fatty acid desaturase (delta-12 desaturase)